MEIDWKKFFSNPDVANLPDEERWTLYAELSSQDPKVSSLNIEDRVDLANQAWETHMPKVFGPIGQDIKNIQASADTLAAISPAPIPGPAGGVNALVSGAANLLAAKKEGIAEFRQEALADEGLSQVVTRPALTGLDSTLEMLRRGPGGVAQSTGAVARGAAENIAAAPSIMEHPIMSVLGPGLATQLVKAIAPEKYKELKLDILEQTKPLAEFGSEAMRQGEQMTAPQLHDTGKIASVAGEVAAQVPNLAALTVSSLTAGAPGAFMASEMMLTGSNADRIEQETGERAPTVATMLALPGAAAETLVFGRAMKMIPGSEKAGFLRRIVEASIGEGAAEGFQQTLERSGVKILDPDFEIFSDEGKMEIWKAAKMGAVLGGMFGMVGGGSQADFDSATEKIRGEIEGAAANFDTEAVLDQADERGAIQEIPMEQGSTPKQTRFTQADAAEVRTKQYDVGYSRISQDKDGSFKVEIFDDTDKLLRDGSFETIGQANEFASQGTGPFRAADPHMDAVIDEYSTMADEAQGADAGRWVTAGENVRKLDSVEDNQINMAIKFAEDLGVPVQLFIDGANVVSGRAQEGVRGVQANDGTLVVRYDQGNPEVTSQTIVKALLEKSLRTDPDAALGTAEAIQSSNPSLWAYASDLAAKQGISDLPGILTIATEVGYKDVLTAMQNPMEVARLSARNENALVSKLRGVESFLSDTMRGFIKHAGGDFLLPHARTGGLLHSLRTSPGYMRLVRDGARLRGLATTADAIRDVIESGRGLLSETDPNQPLVIKSTDPGSAGDVYQTFTFKADEMPGLYKFLNRWIYPNLGIETIEKEITERGGQIDDTIASAQARDLWRSRAMNRVTSVIDSNLRPAMKIINKMKGDRKVNHQEFNDFVTALAALDRNRVLARRAAESGRPPLHSGMTDEQAQSIIDRAVETGKFRSFETAANLIKEINDRSLEMLLEEGLISRQDYENVQRTYGFYMPLKALTKKSTDIEAELGIDRDQVTKDIGISGDVLQRVHGRNTEGISPVIDETLQDLVMRANWAERNRVIKKLAKFSTQYGGRLIRVKNGKANPNDANQVGFREGGVDKKVVLAPGLGLSHGFAEIAPRKLPYLLKWVPKATGIMSKFATTISIPFWFVNLPRDLITAGMQVEGKVAAGDIMENVPAAMKALFQNEFPDATSRISVDPEWAATVEEFKANGGRLSFMGLKEMSDLVDMLKREADYATTNPITWGRRVVHLLESVSGVLENVTRISAFKMARKNGMSPEQAAHFARRLTVDFGRRTQAASALNDWFMFFNAGTQGTARIFENVWRNPKSRRAIARGVMMASTLAIYNAAMGGEDELTGETNWDSRVSGYDKDRNLIIMKPDMSGEYYKIPMPPGYAIFTRLGYFMSDLIRGKEDVSPADLAVRMASAIGEEFSPMSGGRLRTSGYYPMGRGADIWDVARFVTPDAARIIGDLAVNRNQWGSPIRPEGYGAKDTKPDSEKYFSTVNPYIRIMTDAVNSYGGGSKAYPGELFNTDISYSPENLEYLLTHAFTGLGQFADRGTKLMWKMTHGEDVETNDIPIWRRFHGEANDFQIKDDYYAVRDELLAVKNQLDAFQEGEVTPEQMAKFDDKHGWKVQFVDLMLDTEKQLKDVEDETERNLLMKTLVLEFDAIDQEQ